MIAFDCPRCGDEYEVAPDQAGRAAPCLRCGNRLTVPAASEDLGSVGGFRLAPPPEPAAPLYVPPPPTARRAAEAEPDHDETYGFDDEVGAPKRYPKDRGDEPSGRRRPRYDEDEDEDDRPTRRSRPARDPEPSRRPAGGTPAAPMLGVASLAVAAVSLLLAPFAPYLGVLAAIVAGGVGILSLKTPGKVLGLIGLTCAAVLLVANSVLTVLWLAGPAKPGVVPQGPPRSAPRR